MAACCVAALLGVALLVGTAWADDDDAPPPDSVIQAAVDAAADRLQVLADQLVIVATESRDWRDSSLGCPEPDRGYLQVITPGYLVTIDTDDGATEVAVHTDRIGLRAVIC
jgi:hypothetical protein